MEARDYGEAAFLAQEWREPLILQLNAENYAAFLGQYRHWHPRRFIWRLPPIIRESALAFFGQAILTLKQGGFSRFLVGDWGGVALVREAGGLIYGEQTLGVRNSQALSAARELGVSKVCLPPGQGPQDWQDLVQAAPRGSFWGYLYHLPALTTCPRGAGELPVPNGDNLRWVSEGDLAVLIPEAAAAPGTSSGLVRAKMGGPPGDLPTPQQPPLGPGAGPGPTAQAGAATRAGKATAAATPG